MGMHLLRSVPNAAVMFLSFELMSQWLEKRADKSKGETAAVYAAAAR